MKKLTLLLTCLFLLNLSCVSTFKVETTPQIDRQAFSEFLSIRTVRIVVKCTPILPLPEDIKNAMTYSKGGSGTIISSSGKGSFIITADHVIAGDTLTSCDNITIYRSNDIKVKNKIKSTVVVRDPVNDIAMIRVDENLGVNTKIAEKSYVNQRLYAVGFPAAHVKNTNETVSITEGTLATQYFHKDNGYLKVFRFTATAYYGNSGGGVFSENGELLGVVSFMHAEDGIPIAGHYFARPYNLVIDMINDCQFKFVLDVN